MATTEEIRADLAEIVNEVAGIPADDVQLDKSFVDDLDVDSLSMVEVVVAAEEKFGVKIPDDEVKNLKTVGDAVAFIERAQTADSRLPPPAHGWPSVAARPPVNPGAVHHPPRSNRDTTSDDDLRHRVVVTGLGTTSPVGGDVPSTWAALLAGTVRRPAPHRRLGRPAAGKIAGRVAVEPTEVLERVKARRLDRSDAVRPRRRRWRPGPTRASTRTPALDPERLGVAHRLRHRRRHTLLDQLRHAHREGPAPGLPARGPDADAQRPGRQRQPHVGARAAVHTPGLGLRVGQRGHRPGDRPDPPRPRRRGRRRRHRGRDPPAADGGVRQHDGAVQDARRGGDPTTVSRPWDVARDGFVLGEGAGVLVLESEEHARARGARIYAEVLGAGITDDAHDIAQPDPAGRGGTRAIKLALREGDVDPADIVHVNAHATSTPAGRHRRGPDDPRRPRRRTPTACVVTSTKSMTGHLLGGAGALESVATVLALHDRVVPPTINLDDQDPEVELDIADASARPARRRHRRAQQLLRLRRRQRRRRLRQRLRHRTEDSP